MCTGAAGVEVNSGFGFVLTKTQYPSGLGLLQTALIETL